MRVERRLSAFEYALALTNRFAPFNIVGVLELEPLPDEAQLEVVLGSLQKRHPLLNVAVSPEGNHFRYVTEGVGPVPVRTVSRAHAQSWQQVTEAALNTRLAETEGPLLQLTRVADPSQSRGELVVTSHHAIMDGVCMTTLLRDLLIGCRCLIDGANLPQQPTLEPAPPLDELYPFSKLGRLRRLPGFMLRQILDELRYRHHTRNTPKAPVHAEGNCRILPIRIEGTRIASLGSMARKHRVTPHDVLHAAMLIAVNRALYDHQAGALRGIAFADLRPFLRPTMDAEHLGSYISMMRYTANMNGELWDIAQCISRQLYAMGKRGDKFLAASLTKPLMRMMLSQTKQRMAATALSFMQKVPLETNGPIRLHNLHGFVSSNVVGPQFSALGRVFDGALCLDCLYLDCDMDADQALVIGQEIGKILTNL